MNLIRLVITLAFCSLIFPNCISGAAESAVQQAVATTWTDAERTDTLNIINEQLKNSARLEEYNNTWSVAELGVVRRFLAPPADNALE